MKYKVLLLIIWMIISLVLVCSIIGIVLFISNDSTKPSTWESIGIKLLNNILEQ